MEERPEFFKLDEVDRKILMILVKHVHPDSVRSWMKYIEEDYRKRKGVIVDIDKLYKETFEN